MKLTYLSLFIIEVILTVMCVIVIRPERGGMFIAAMGVGGAIGFFILWKEEVADDTDIDG